jgi:hypothetical protein
VGTKLLPGRLFHVSGKGKVTTMFEQIINQSANSSEQDFRLAILNALLRTPHKEVAPYIPLFRFVHERDPLFFGHLAAWYLRNGTVHDLKQLFIACLVTSRFSDEYRDSGIAMLQELPPFQVERVLGLVKGHKEEGKFIEGVAASVPRSLRTAIEEYLRLREKDQRAFDNVALHARSSLKKLYASLRIKPSQYAQMVLFDNEPPDGSRLKVLKEIAQATEPSEQARLIVEHRIPYRIASSVIKQMTPAVLVAIVASMTPQEIINNLASLKRRGAMDNPDLRKLVEQKLEQGKSDKRVSALKTRQAMKAADLDEEMTAKVEAVGDRQIKSKAKIKRATALHIDKSGSMQLAIEVGKQIASIIAPVCEADLFVYAFDVMAYPIQAKGTELSHWEKAFKGIVAGGGTSCGVALQTMLKKQQRVEQIVMVTDQEENQLPRLADVLKAYSDEINVLPDVIIVHIGGKSDYLEKTLKDKGISCDVYTFSGDYYSLPGLLPLIAGGTRLDLLSAIMDHPMPERKAKQLAVAALS